MNIITLKDIKGRICCTCLSTDRVLTTLVSVPDGVANLFNMLQCSPYKFYKDILFKDVSRLHVCWECSAFLLRLCKFQRNAGSAIKLLSSLVNGTSKAVLSKSLSTLSRSNEPTAYMETDDEPKKDCDSDDLLMSIPVTVILKEGGTVHVDKRSDCSDTDDASTGLLTPIKTSQNGVPVMSSRCGKQKTVKVDIEVEDWSKMNVKNMSDIIEEKRKEKERIEGEQGNGKCRKEKSQDECFSVLTMFEEELVEYRRKMMADNTFEKASFKCNACIEVFKSQYDLQQHNTDYHTQRYEHDKCKICTAYIPKSIYKEHVERHYIKYKCLVCESSTSHVTRGLDDMVTHLATSHSMTISCTKVTINARREIPVQASDALDDGTSLLPPMRVSGGRRGPGTRPERVRAHPQRKHAIKAPKQRSACRVCRKQVTIGKMTQHMRRSHQQQPKKIGEYGYCEGIAILP